MNPFIYTAEKELSSDFCRNLIDKFENDNRKHPGVLGQVPRVELDSKISTDLHISQYDDWKEEDNVFFNSLTTSLPKYVEFLKKVNPDYNPYGYLSQVNDTGYQIQKTEPGGFYTWHSDFIVSETLGPRLLSFIWYLNDVNYEGHTEFYDGTKIKPEEGKLVIFPATWDFLHRGVSPEKETKYISTGWVYVKDECPES